MKRISPPEARIGLALAVAAVVLGGGCRREHEERWQGYLEGEFVYVASPLAGRLETLAVAKGATVAVGAPLFELERNAELAAQAQATQQWRAAEARLADVRKGARPAELAALEARLEQSRAAEQLAQLEFARREELRRTDVVPASDYDRARLTYAQASRQVEELAAQLETARLGGRADAIAATEADVAAARAALERANWSVEQKSQAAPRAGFVFDTLYRPGEYVPAGTPVVALLPPENLKVRFFVSEAQFATLRAGAEVHVHVTGRPALTARVSYLSPKPEYTPPILYNRENRAKLVFLIEATFEPGATVELHPGQPVDVTRGAR